MFWFNLATPVVMVVAVWIAYQVGKRSRDLQQSQPTGDLSNAKQVVEDLEHISQQVRRSLVDHHASIVQFKERISALGDQAGSEAWQNLAREADQIMQPTMELASQIAHAYDDVRRQTNQLSAPDQLRTDRLTGLSNRRAMEDIMRLLFEMKGRYRTRFSLAMIDIDGFKQVNAEVGYARGNQLLKAFAALLDHTVRDTDVVVRFGGEEFAVVMPETDLSGAGIFARRFVDAVQRDLSLPTSLGVAEATDGDTIQSLVSRTDSALYSAKSSGGGCVFQHTGRHIELLTAGEVAVSALNSAASHSAASHAPDTESQHEPLRS